MTLRIDNLHVAYDAPVLEGVSLELQAGQSGFLLGPSGSGKTTVLRVIAGLQRADSGAVSWQGEPLDDVPTHRRGVGMMFQEPALFPHMNVVQNVAFGLKYRGVARVNRRAEASAWLELVGLADRADSKVDELSGGQRQRVALARTLAAKPRIVLLDEPFSALDRELRDEMGSTVKQLLAEQGVAALWVTHDEEEARRLGDVVWRVRDGQLADVTNGASDAVSVTD